MNLPNRLTILRVIFIPFFLFFALVPSIPGNNFYALGIFAIASATDWLDGYLARKNKLVTNFGKFLDPLADKVLVMAALICFVETGYVGCIPVIIILAREFMVTALRLVAASNVVIAAGVWGKLKTAFTMIAIIFIFALNGLVQVGVAIPLTILGLISGILIWIATALTVISGIQYLWSYRKYIDTKK